MNFPRENSYLTFSGSRWIQPGLRTRKRHLHALKSLFIARAREKTWSASFFSNRSRAFAAPHPSRTMADRVQGNPELKKKKKKGKRKKKNRGFKRPRRRAFHWGDIEFSRVWRGGREGGKEGNTGQGGGSSGYYDPSKFSARFTCDWLRVCDGSWTGVVNNNLRYS